MLQRVESTTMSANKNQEADKAKKAKRVVDTRPPEQVLRDAVAASPELYRGLRVHRVVRIDGKLTKLRAEGEYPLTVFDYEGGLVEWLAYYWGGEAAGTPYDCQLVDQQGGNGPSRRVRVFQDKRPPEVRSPSAPAGGSASKPPPDYMPPAGWQMNAGGQGGMPNFNMEMPFPPTMEGFMQLKMWQQMVKMFDEPKPAPSASDGITEQLLKAVLLNMQNTATAQEKGVRAGMELAQEIHAKGQAPAGAEIATAIGDALANIAGVVVGSGVSLGGGKVEAVDVKDPAHLGWLVASAIQQNWPVDRAVAMLQACIGVEELQKLVDQPEALQKTLQEAASAHKPLLGIIKDNQPKVAAFINALQQHFGGGAS